MRIAEFIANRSSIRVTTDGDIEYPVNLILHEDPEITLYLSKEAATAVVAELSRALTEIA